MITSELKNPEETTDDRSVRIFYKDGVKIDELSEKQVRMNIDQSQYIINEHQEKINLLNEMLGSIQ